MHLSCSDPRLVLTVGIIVVLSGTTNVGVLATGLLQLLSILLKADNVPSE
jgi:hypothetical protein